jgi:hypothetical protein
MGLFDSITKIGATPANIWVEYDDPTQTYFEAGKIFLFFIFLRFESH